MKKIKFLGIISLFLILTGCSDNINKQESNISENKISENYNIKENSKTNNSIKDDKSNDIQNIKTVSVNEFKNYIYRKDTILIDLRTPEELKQTGVINSKAINLNVYNPNFPNEINKLDRNKTYLIYCRSGSRSSKVREFMKKLGFKNIIELKGGIINWYNKGEKFYKYKKNEKK